MSEMLLVGLLIGLVAGTLTFTGNVPHDFPASQTNVTTTANFKAGLFQIYLLFDGVDVGAPPGWPYVTNGAVSGWDFEDIRFQYDYALDNLNIGINFYGVASDADNDGDPAHTSAELQARGGQDNPNFAQSESCAIVLDWGNTSSNVPDGVFDFVIGYPNTIPGDSDRYPNNANAFPPGSTCAVNLDTSCFGLYLADQTNLMDNPGARFLYKAANPAIQLAASMSLLQDHNAPTSKTKPHLEWTIQETNALRSAAGFPAIDQKGVTPFEIGFAAFCGSFQDDGIGEDYFPNIGNYALLNFPCQVFDACDVCGGDGSSCADCAGVPNGPHKYDVCDVCGGNGSTCRDCQGTANGPATYDRCDVCNGNGSSCLDCEGTPFGTCKYDACDVCCGSSSTCLDCKSIPNGPNRYDQCDVCGGNGQSCLDCAGKPFGLATYDRCDVCNGNGQSCLDCKGTLFGTCQYDACDVCCGNSLECLVVPPERNPCLPRFNSDHACQTFPGDVFLTQFRLDAKGGALAGHDAAITFGERGMAIVDTSVGEVYERWLTDTPLGGDIEIGDAGALPSELACGESQEGSYTYEWSRDCKWLALKQTNDLCPTRSALLWTSTVPMRFRREHCQHNEWHHDRAECKFRPGTYWFGRYASGEWLSLVFSVNSFLATVSGADQHYFGKQTSGHRTLVFTQVGSVPDGLGCGNQSSVGEYQVAWHDDDCTRATIEKIDEPCTARYNMFGKMTIELVDACRGGIPRECEVHVDDDDDDHHRHHHHRHSDRSDDDDDEDGRRSYHSRLHSDDDDDSGSSWSSDSSSSSSWSPSSRSDYSWSSSSRSDDSWSSSSRHHRRHSDDDDDDDDNGWRK